VLFVLNESVRAKSSCVAYTPNCEITPFSNEATRDRFPLLQMRTVDSTTAISLLVMWSGSAPEVSREKAHTAPLVWEYAAAAGLDTAYWTSQNMLFGNSGRWLESMHFTRGAHAAELEDSPPLETGADDARLVDRVIADVPALKQPFVGVVHLSNTHFPYRIDADDAPFKPEGEDPSYSHRVEIQNRYHDAIYHQDRSIARLVQEVRKAAPDTVIVYASDHGEQMFEKGSHSHTGTLFEPEVHIPAWVDAPPGTLTAAEAQGLRDARDKPVTSLDIFPTLMDLLHLWDAKELSSFRATMPGESLLRGGSNEQTAHVMSNCTGLWACAFRNWGAIAGRRKLIATQSDQDWLCFDVVADPEEEHALPKAACGDLIPVAESLGRPF
jgi:arylsulfatase A-like enzyme